MPTTNGWKIDLDELVMTHQATGTVAHLRRMLPAGYAVSDVASPLHAAARPWELVREARLALAAHLHMCATTVPVLGRRPATLRRDIHPAP